MITLKNVSFSYNKTPFIKNLNIEFDKGKFYAVIGPNGCGKTTLLNILARQANVHNGSISLDNKSYSNFKRKEFAKKAAFLPQFTKSPDMTVWDMVSYARFPYLGISGKLSSQDKKAVNDALKKTSTIDFVNRNVNELSGGERQRVYIAMLLAQQTEYIFLDEPTTYLDIENQFTMMELLKKIRCSGKCVVTVIHELSLALRFCDIIIVMNHGKIVAKDTPQEIVSQGYIDNVFNVSCQAVTVGGIHEYIINPKEQQN